jgi:hypothetical protein
MRERVLFATLLADARDHGALDAANDVAAVVQFLDRGDDGLDFRLGSVRLHYDDHEKTPLRAKIGISISPMLDYIRMVRANKV